MIFLLILRFDKFLWQNIKTNVPQNFPQKIKQFFGNLSALQWFRKVKILILFMEFYFCIMLKHCNKILIKCKNCHHHHNYVRDTSVSLRWQIFTTWSYNHMEEWLIFGKSETENVVIENDITRQWINNWKVPVLDERQERISYINSNFDMQLWLGFAIIY